MNSLTRSDFEALLWNHLGMVLPTGPGDLIPELPELLGFTLQQWAALSDGARAEAFAALDVVKGEVSRRIWQGADQ